MNPGSSTDPKDSTLIVSGGSRGLGLAILTRYLAAGARVASFARSETPEVIALREQHADRFRFEVLEAGDAARLESFVGGVASAFGEIHGLVNNAAIGQDHLLAHMSPGMIASIIEVNLTAPIVLTRAVIRRMLLNAAGGRIVNISSICGSRGYPGLTAYSATKGGLDAFTRSLARELGERHILVNSLAPGFFESQMSSALAAQQLATIKRRTPTGRLCTEEHILSLLDQLLFGASNVTGQTWCVDGGASI